MGSVDAVVIGAGVVGIAIGRALTELGLEVLVIERARRFGSETSSRNSEVIHAGLYYPQGSLKASLCVEGRDLLYDYCAARSIAHRRCGKLIVATNDAQLGKLDAIDAAARANGVDVLRRMDADEVRRLEPAVRCVGALHSPITGIVDSHQFMLAMVGDAEAKRGAFAYGANVTRIERSGGRFRLYIAGEEGAILETRIVINAAGLGAAKVAQTIVDLAEAHVPTVRYAKGNYFAYSGRPPFSRLVYPVPEDGGLGVHATVDLAGRVRFGPDVEWCSNIEYGIDANRSSRFYHAVRAYWPALPDGSLVPDYCGIRPKLSGPGEPAADFLISGPDDHGLSGLVNLFGIESPGLTASLAIAAYVGRLVEA